MKAGFGLAGILVTLGIVVWLWSKGVGGPDSAKQAIDAKRSVESSGITGRNADGGKISDTVTLEPMTAANGKVKGLLVSRIDPGNVLATKYGLRQFDRIDKVNGLSFETLGIDPETQVLEAPTRGWTLQVTRGSQELTLPQAVTGPGTAQPQPPAGGGDPIRRQLDAIKVPTH